MRNLFRSLGHEAMLRVPALRVELYRTKMHSFLTTIAEHLRLMGSIGVPGPTEAHAKRIEHARDRLLQLLDKPTPGVLPEVADDLLVVAAYFRGLTLDPPFSHASTILENLAKELRTGDSV